MELRRLLLEVVRSIGGSDEVLETSTMISVGMDSFSMVELTSKVKQEFGVEVPTSKIRPTTTVHEFVTLIVKMYSGGKVFSPSMNQTHVAVALTQPKTLIKAINPDGRYAHR